MGLTVILLTDKGFGLAVVLVFVASILSVRATSFSMLHRLDRLFILLLCFFPSLVLFNLIYHNIFSWRDFDIASRFLLFIPVYLLLRSKPVNINHLVVGAAFGCLATASYCVYYFLGAPGARVTLYDNPITFGQIAFLITAIALIPNSLFFHKTYLARLSLLFFSCLGVICITLNQSRGVFLAIPLLFIYLFYFQQLFKLRMHEVILVMAGTSIILVLVGSNPLFSYLSNLSNEISVNFQSIDTSSSLGIRLTLWLNSLELISQQPFSGFGVGQFKFALGSLAEKNLIAPEVLEFSHAHNELLNLWVELGILGPIALITFFLVPWHIASREKFSLQSRYLLILVFLTWLLFGLSQTQLAHQKITMLQLLLLCIGFAHGMNEKFGSTQSRAP